MNLLEKIEQVKIKADTRISEDDRDFCERQQRAYDAARETLTEMDFIWADSISRQKAIFEEMQGVPDRYAYYLGNGKKLDATCFKDELECLHGRFIKRLTSYFENTYSVELSAEKIIEQLLPAQKDREPREKMNAAEVYHKAMRELALRYTSVLDRILIQLDGRSFQEKAFLELRGRCRDAVWSGCKAEPQYVQQKETIHFTGYFCTADTYWTPPHWEISGQAKNVLRGVIHFETGSYKAVPTEFSAFFSYRDVRQPCTDIHGCRKIRQIRLFKNGRMDIRFASSALAEQFIDVYLSAAYS